MFATPAQNSYIAALLKERSGPVELADAAANPALTKAQASSLINALKSCPYAETKKVSTSPLERGYYAHGDAIYEIVESKTGNRYAKQLIVKGKRGKWEFIPGAMKSASQWTKVTLDDAKTYGKKFGVCMACGRTLTNSESVEAGIGPVCGGKF